MVIAQRMAGQRLWGEPFTGIEDCVRTLGAIQAQEFAYAKWSVGQRTRNVTEPLVDKAFAEGTLLRTHLMRPTWHFVLPEDIRWLIELTAPRINALSASYLRREGLDDAFLAKARRLFTDALRGGNHLARRAMQEVLSKGGLPVSNFQLGFVLMRAELDLVICSGAPAGKQQTYALVEERAPNAVTRPRDEAVAELVRRYFATRGPATLKDFAWWSGLTQADGRRVVDGSYQSEVVNGRTYWYLQSQVIDPPPSPHVDLVQIYDEIGMSYSESRDALSGGQERPEPAYYHSILLDGRLIGHWRRAVSGTGKGKAIVFETQLFRPFKGAERDALEAAQERYRAFSMAETTSGEPGAAPERNRATT